MAILHITLSLATQGSMKLAIRQHHLQRSEAVLNIHDIFSIGPLENMEERKSWLASHIFREQEDQQLYDDLYANWQKKIANVPCDVDVWIWYSQNAHEQIGLRYVISEFVNKCNMVYGVDATEGLQRLQANTDIRYTGELSSEMLMRLRADAKRFSIPMCQRLAKEWEELKRYPSTLRLWDQGIVHVEENALDAMLLSAVQELHQQHQQEWIELMHIIGAAYDTFHDYISEEFLINRIMMLNKQGSLQVEGDLTDIHACRVKYMEA
ncbi:DUF1835 domain-containing protein [Lysinibacillus sp. FSL K6-0232]|uniref:DUF1835 domain-containing protein n=1 Tax=unclassified Lysinibacillus TaxID=2636778 RepID=UPI0030F94A74